PAAEAMPEALLVVDVEARRLLVVERAARLELPPGLLELDGARDEAGQRGPGAQLVEELRAEAQKLPSRLREGSGEGLSIKTRSIVSTTSSTFSNTSLFQKRRTR